MYNIINDETVLESSNESIEDMILNRSVRHKRISEEYLVNDLTIPTQVKVDKVDKKGSIKKASLNEKGVYLDSPDSLQVFDSAELELEFSASDRRIIEDRSISNIL